MNVRRNGVRSLLAVLALAFAAAPVLAGDASLTGIVNVNTATVDQLVLLPGIGESRANALIQTREPHLLGQPSPASRNSDPRASRRTRSRR